MIAGMARWRGWRIVSTLAFVLFFAFLAFSATTRGAWDWDMIPYTMAVLRGGEADIAALHAKTWALIKDHVPARAFAELSSLGVIRQTMHANPAALASQLPLFESKFGYIVLLKAVSLVTDPVSAMRAVSLASALGILLILFGECWSIEGIASLVWVPLVGLFGLSSLATMLSPDPSPLSSTSWPLPPFCPTEQGLQ